jgi:lycopene cyclase domain-containing protein
VRQFTYLLLLAACLLGTSPLEFALGTRVYRQWRRLVLTLLPVVVVFGGWDAVAAAWHWWHYDGAYVVGWTVLGHLPIEEVLFFLVVPTCAVLTLEAVRVRRPHWLIGDEQ